MKKIFLILLLTGFSAVAQNKAAQLDSIYSSAYSKGNFSGNVLIAEKGNVIYKKSFGLRDEALKLPLDDNSVFELASVSKQFTAMAIVLLKEKGKLQYEDRLAMFFPELGFYDDITVRQLLNHTGGLPDYMEFMVAGWDKSKIATNKDIISYMVSHKPEIMFTSGTQYVYSNTGYALLASIIEKVSGMSYGDFLKQHIFKPLKMDDTFVYTRRYAPKQIANYAYGYVTDDKNNKALPDNLADYAEVIWLDGIVGDGTVNSTTGDLLKWDRALYTDTLAPKKAIEEMFTPPAVPGLKTDYGFGWMIEDSKNYGRITSHTGGWPGYKTLIERHTTNDKTIIILQNNYNSKTQAGLVRKVLYGQPLVVKHTEIQLTEKDMLPFIGGYELAPGYVMEIMYEGGLKTQMPGQEKFDLFAESKTKFFLKVVDAQLEFVRDDKGAVTKAVLYQGGREMEALKVR